MNWKKLYIINNSESNKKLNKLQTTGSIVNSIEPYFISTEFWSIGPVDENTPPHVILWKLSFFSKLGGDTSHTFFQKKFFYFFPKFFRSNFQLQNFALHCFLKQPNQSTHQQPQTTPTTSLTTSL